MTTQHTTIEWTDRTWNPVTGCTKVSPGCDHCYAETIAHRFAGSKAFPNGFNVTLHEARISQPLRWKKPARVFVNSMSDLFHADVPDDFIARVWQVMSATPQHTYQILTKRHARMRSWTKRWYAGEISEPYDVRSIPGYEGYSITTHGEVLGKRADTRGGMKQEAGEKGHLRVMLYRDGQQAGKRELVHRLVLTAFVRPPRPGEQACHRNGDPSDNRLSNLYWGTQEDNWRDRLAHGNGRSYHKLTEQQVAEIRNRHAASETAVSIAEAYGVSDTQIRNIVLNRQWVKARLIKAPTPAPARVVLDNCWLGVSVENQRWADIRIPALLETPAAVRFLSCEPLLGPVWFADYASQPCGCCLGEAHDEACRDCADYGCDGGHVQALHWVIAGGESGQGARAMHPDWARSLRDQCAQERVPFFFKQFGEWGPAPFIVRVCDPNVGWQGTEEELAAAKADSEARGATHVHTGNWYEEDGERRYWLHEIGHKPWSLERVGLPDGTAAIRRWGKKRAGRELDGRLHDEFPSVAAVEGGL